MKKLSLFMLMAVGLLISGNAWGTEVKKLSDLRNALKNGGEIVLGADINVNMEQSDQILWVESDATLDLNGHTIKGSTTIDMPTAGVLNVQNTANLTLKATNGGSVVVNETSAATQAIYSLGGLTIEGGYYFGTDLGIYIAKEEGKNSQGTTLIKGDTRVEAVGRAIYCGVGKSGNEWKIGTITIEGNPTFESRTKEGLYTGLAVVNVHGGTFKSVTENRGAVASGEGHLNIYDGTFIAPEGTPCATKWCVVNIYGGTFSNNLNSDELKDGAEYFLNNDGTYTVALPTAMVNGTKYPSLDKAIQSAQDGDEVVLLATTITEEVAVDGKKIVINLNEKSLGGTLLATNNAEVTIIGEGEVTCSFSQSNNGKIYACGGTYTFDPTSYVPQDKGCEVTQSDGKWIVKQYTAQVGETKYASFKEAVAAANAITEGPITITLLNNATLADSPLSITKSMTIALNGNVLSSITPAKNQTSKLNIKGSNISVTIQGGTINNAKSALSYPSSLLAQTGTNTLVLDGVTIENKGNYAVEVNSAANTSLQVINGTTLKGAKSAIYASKDITLTNGTNLGELLLADVAATITNNSGASLNINTSVENGKTLTIDNKGTLNFVGGKYKGTISFQNSTTALIKGGLYSETLYNSISAMIDGSNYQWNKINYLGETYYQVVDKNCTFECQVGETKYVTLKDAISYIPTATEVTITLLKDITLDLVDADFTTSSVYYNINNRKVTLELGNYNITANYPNGTKSCIIFNVENNASLTFAEATGKVSLTANVPTQVSYILQCNNGCKLTINGGTFENLSQNSLLGYCLQMAAGASFEINGGKIYSQYFNAARIFGPNKQQTDFIINGGVVEGKGGCWIQLSSSGSSLVKFEVNGGQLIGNDSEALDITSNGASYKDVNISIKQGAVVKGAVCVGVGAEYDGDLNENVSITGGTFETHNQFSSGKRGIERQVISGGAFYFDYENNTTDPKTYAQFCEYIEPGHYAVKMYRNDNYTGAEGTFKDYDGHRYVFMDDATAATAKTFWAVIDAKGTFEPVVIEKSKELTQADISAYADLQVVGEGVQVTIPITTTVNVNKVDVGEGAGIIVMDGAVLNVGTGGIDINGEGDGTTFVKVMPGGMVTTDGTISSTDVKEIIINADTENGSGSVLISPDVNFNNQPKSTIQMATKARKAVVEGQDVYYWQHFGIPSIGNGDFKNPTAPKISINKSVDTYINSWENGQWVPMGNISAMNVPFRGYNLTNTSADGAIYTFEGYMMGNGNAPLHFYQMGYNVMGNSYTAPMYVKEMLEEITEQFGTNVEATVWIYNSEKDNHTYVTKHDIDYDEAEFEAIASMQGFILKLSNNSSAEGTINYEETVWNNPMKTSVPLRTPKTNTDAIKANIVVTSSVSNSVVKLRESNEFTGDFDNGIDASKLMDNHFNIFASTEAGELATVATNDLNGTYLSMNTVEEAEFTMTFEKVQNMDYHIIDMLTGYEVAILEGNTYKFSAPANTKMENRFQVVATAKVPTALMNRTTSDKVNGIYSIMGQYVGNVDALKTLPQGVYVTNGVKIIK